MVDIAVVEQRAPAVRATLSIPRLGSHQPIATDVVHVVAAWQPPYRPAPEDSVKADAAFSVIIMRPLLQNSGYWIGHPQLKKNF